MVGYRRYAVYAAPEGALGAFGAAWLGWDATRGAAAEAREVVPGLPCPAEELVAGPDRYGFHATIKAPFRLDAGRDADALDRALAAFAAAQAPVALEGLRLARLGAFVALVAEGETAALDRLAAETVRELDGFRAPLQPEEVARRRPERLSPRQKALLDRWGYPFVMEEFRFHLTLTARLPPGQAEAVEAALAPRLAPVLPRPFPISSLCLFGEAADGYFRLLRRYPLAGG
ncbi:DUF1045 domain-containing protein [Solirhodobacter olei]|uniref:DUF1045 domain-containing protein n=1 Tax=Solirhodobacter olei TaxID=2493082 RepID=UPI000FDC87B5|nr:DUF1045 domain-containing protein [Solirhodobacter olei]